MKKLLVLLMAALILTACGSNEQKPADKNSATAKSTETSEEAAKYPEYSTVVEKVGGGDFTLTVETDDDNERVLIFEDNDGTKYKSVLNKAVSTLKIYDVEADRAIYNNIFREEK